MADENDFNMTPVSSSQIEAVGFCTATGQGKVQFLKNGSEYVYESCTQDEATQIINGAIGGSVGVSFSQIWKGTKPFRRIS
jgi:hypothetical protein